MSPPKEKEPLSSSFKHVDYTTGNSYTIARPEIPCQEHEKGSLTSRTVAAWLEADLTDIKAERERGAFYAGDVWQPFKSEYACFNPIHICIPRETRIDPTTGTLEYESVDPVIASAVICPLGALEAGLVASCSVSISVSAIPFAVGFSTMLGAFFCPVPLGLIGCSIVYGISKLGKKLVVSQYNDETRAVTTKVQSVINGLYARGDVPFDINSFIETPCFRIISTTFRYKLLSALSMMQIEQLRQKIGENQFQMQYGAFLTPQAMRCLEFLSNIKNKDYTIETMKGCLLQIRDFLKKDSSIWQALCVRLPKQHLQDETIMKILKNTAPIEITGSNLEENIMLLSQHEHTEVTITLHAPTGELVARSLPLTVLLEHKNLFSKFFESQHREIMLEVTAEELEAFSDFIEFLKEKRCAPQNVVALFTLADRFELFDLRRACQLYVHKLFQEDKMPIEYLELLFIHEEECFKDLNRKVLCAVFNKALVSLNITVLNHVLALALKHEIDEVFVELKNKILENRGKADTSVEDLLSDLSLKDEPAVSSSETVSLLSSSRQAPDRFYTRVSLWHELVMRLAREHIQNEKILRVLIETAPDARTTNPKEVENIILKMSEYAHTVVEITLKAGGNSKTHRIPLAPLFKYTYFLTMFTSKFREAESQRLELDVSEEEQAAFTNLVEYINTKKCNWEDLFALFSLANRFEMDDLIQECHSKIHAFFKNGDVSIEDLNHLFVFERANQRESNRKLLLDALNEALNSVDRSDLKKIFALANIHNIHEVFSQLLEKAKNNWKTGPEFVHLLYEFDECIALREPIERYICSEIRKVRFQAGDLNRYSSIPSLVQAIRSVYAQEISDEDFKQLWDLADTDSDSVLKESCCQYYKKSTNRSALSLLWELGKFPKQLSEIDTLDLVI